MPRNPKPGAPLAKKEEALAKALPESYSVADAGRKAGFETRQATHDAYKALKVKAPMRCAQLGISRDKVLQRFDHWADHATREKMYGQFGDTKKLEATDLRIKANTELAKIMNLYEKPEDNAAGASKPDRHTVCVVVSDPEAARGLVELFSSRGTAGVVIDVDAEVHENVG